MVFFTVNGKLPGSGLNLKSRGKGAEVTIRADARWMGGITGISIIVNGETVHTEYGGGKQKLAVNRKILLERSSWIAVKVDGLPVDVFNGCAHSAPVYVTLDNQPIRSREDARYFVEWIDKHIALLDSASHFDTPEHRERTFALYRKGQEVYREMEQVPGDTAARMTSEEENVPRFMAALGMRMAKIPAGTFTMGSNFENDPGNPYKGKVSFKDEQPVHRVTVSEFEMSATEVTVGQFRRFVSETGYCTEAEQGDGALVYLDGKWVKKSDASWKNPYQELREDLPAGCVSWNDAVRFCEWLSRKTGREFRLPTEAEWEYACRAGSKTAYYAGERESDLFGAGWYRANSSWKMHPVAGKRPNAWGLYDMHGNLWEWCGDWLGEYSSGSQSDPKGPQAGAKKVFRGGSWYTNTNYCRSAAHYGYPPESRDTSIGFRVVRSVSTGKR
jgi:formylglycine-generating enzyme required for sulfatase activity